VTRNRARAARVSIDMAHALDTGRKGSVNIELNIIPFIDVMSCLTAFLLVTAVWIHMAGLTNAPVTGKGADGEPKPRIAILLDADDITVSSIPADPAAAVDTRQVRAADWDGLASLLQAMRPAGEIPHVEIAAESTREHPVSYQVLVAAMDTTLKAGYPDVGVSDPRLLAR
jgi:biopolymer transport protein ExbD